MSIYDIQPITLAGAETYPIAERRSKVDNAGFCAAHREKPLPLKKFPGPTAANSGRK